MPDRFEDLEARLESLARDLRRVEDPPRPAGSAAGTRRGAPGTCRRPCGRCRRPVPPRDLSQGTLALAGRTLVALGGGYLIRAMTDAGVLPALGGVALGLAYAVLWLAVADRAARAGRRASAASTASRADSSPIRCLWETTTRFRPPEPSTALTILVLVFGVGIAVTARHRLGSVAWVITSLAVGTTAGLLFSTHHLLAAVLALLAMACSGGVAGPTAISGSTCAGPPLSSSTPRSWPWSWSGPGPAGLPEGYPLLPTGAAVAATLGLTALYTASIVARTLGRGCPVTPFELAQGTAALVLGLAGAWEILAARGAAPTTLGGLSLLLGALSYAAAFAFVERRTGHGRNFYFYSTVGSLLTLVGSRAILEGHGLERHLVHSGPRLRLARATLRSHDAALPRRALHRRGRLRDRPARGLLEGALRPGGEAGCCPGSPVGRRPRPPSRAT